jgi:hypothetical protein
MCAGAHVVQLVACSCDAGDSDKLSTLAGGGP